MEEKTIVPGNGKIFIGIPRERIYLTQFVDNRDTILAYLGKKKIMGGYFQAESHRVDRNRDRIVDEFLKAKTNPEWLVMIDTDMEHPIDCAIRLTSYGKPIVGALYFARGPTSHTPFAFKEIENPKNDDYGRPTLAWVPLSKIVYDFLQNNNVPMRDGGLTIDQAIGESLIECDAVATGCIAIHRSVIEDMPKPIFEYRPHGNSEDLVFCREAKARGWRIYCDLSTICGHFHWVPMGQAQFRMNYLNGGINETSYTKRQAAKWYSQSFGGTEEDAVKVIEKGNSHMVGKLWRKRFGKRKPSDAEVTEFYRDPDIGKQYIVELLHWNFSMDFGRLRQMFIGIRESNVIDLGAGIGTTALQLLAQDNNVLAVEVNQALRDFIDMRYIEFKEAQFEELPEFSIVDETWKEKCEDSSFDACVAIDVFEHMPALELEATIKALSRIIKPNGRIVFHNNWGQQDLYPMHFKNKELFKELLLNNKFMLVNEMEAMHV